MRRNLLLLIILALVLTNAYMLYNFYRSKLQYHNDIAVISKHNETDMDELLSLRFNFENTIINSESDISQLVIKDSSNNVFPISKIFEHNQKRVLVLRFSERHCESCVTKVINRLIQNSDSIGIENVVILASYRNNRVFNIQKPLYNIENIETYNTPIIDLPVENLLYPYFFILDSKLKVTNVFVPEKAVPALTDKYLKFITKRYFN